MEFMSGLQWGAGFTLGGCVGLVAWVFLREATNRLFGITRDNREHLQLTRASVELLEDRNRLTCDTNYTLKQIAISVEKCE